MIKRGELFNKTKRKISPQKRTAKIIKQIRIKYSLGYRPAIRLYQLTRTDIKKPIIKLTAKVHRNLNKQIEKQHNIALRAMEIKKPQTTVREAFFSIDTDIQRMSHYKKSLAIQNLWNAEQVEEYVKNTSARREYEKQNFGYIESQWITIDDEIVSPTA